MRKRKTTEERETPSERIENEERKEDELQEKDYVEPLHRGHPRQDVSNERDLYAKTKGKGNLSSSSATIKAVRGARSTTFGTEGDSRVYSGIVVKGEIKRAQEDREPDSRGDPGIRNRRGRWVACCLTRRKKNALQQGEKKKKLAGDDSDATDRRDTSRPQTDAPYCLGMRNDHVRRARQSGKGEVRRGERSAGPQREENELGTKKEKEG